MFFLSEINLIIPLKSELLTLAEVLQESQADCSNRVTDKHSLHVLHSMLGCSKPHGIRAPNIQHFPSVLCKLEPFRFTIFRLGEIKLVKIPFKFSVGSKT